MSLTPGSLLGPYHLLAPLGAGGMGEVYRAHDTRLHREVAIKILPASLAADPASLARFEREAQAVAALSHPNILSIHDAGQVNGVAYAVAELLEGRNLREVLADGPLPPRKALEFGLQIAHGLAAAHEKGIVHRDLKPENVFVTSDARVKILDFGLAQVVTTMADSQHTTVVLSPSPGTAPGMVVGTVGYMAPEQVRGQAVDGRTDIFAFGVLLYEMLSGRRAFAGETPADTMSAILRSDPPDLIAMQPDMPPPIDRIVRRCLEKRPAERFQSARDLGFAIEALSGVTTPRAIVVSPSSWRSRRAAWASMAAAAGLLVGLGLATLLFRRDTPADPITVRFTIPSGLAIPPWVAVARDGQAISWSAGGLADNTQRSWFRRLTDSNARLLPRTEDVTAAVWLNDNRRLLLVRGPQLIVLDIESGSQSVLREAPESERRAPLRGIAVGPNDELLMGANNSIQRLPLRRDAQATVVRTAEGPEHTWVGFPQWLPDGTRMLYTATREDGTGVDTYVAPLAGGAATRLDLPSSITRVLVDPSGFIVYGINGTLQGRRVDFATLALGGPPFQVSTDILLEQRTGAVAADLSPAGTLAYRTLGFAHVQFEWVDRAGRPIRPIGGVDTFTNFDLSPDEERLAVTRRETETVGNSLWMIDESRATTTELADSSRGSISDPTWSPDGTRIAYRRGNRLIVRGAFGGAETELAQWTGYPDSWSRDGRYLLVGRPMQQAYDIWAVRADGTKDETAVITGAQQADEARFSPDGRWIAYHATADNTPFVYAIPFPPTGERWQISTRGGVQPRWRGDGRELYYLDMDGQLMRVELPGGDPRQARPAEPLFRTTLQPSSAVDQFTVSSDGQRFVLRRPVGEHGTDQAPLTVIVNWRGLQRVTR